MADTNTPKTPASTPSQVNASNDLRSELDHMSGNTAASTSNTSSVTPTSDLRADLDGKQPQVAANAAQDPASAMNAIEPAAGNPMAQSATQAGPVSAAPTSLAASGLASQTLSKPVAGQTQVVHVSPGEILATQFDPESANLKMEGKNLVMSFDDGSRIVLDGFASDISQMPSIALSNGALVAGGVIVAQLQGTSDDLFNLETAAGGSAGGGNFIYSDDLGGIINLLEKLPPIPFTALTFNQPELPEYVPQLVTPPIGGSFVPTITTPVTTPDGNPVLNPDGSVQVVAGGFEDWQAHQNVGNFNETPMELNIAFTPQTNEVVDLVTISNIPAGVQFFYRDASGTVSPLTITGGSFTLSGADIANGRLLILPPDNSDKDIPFTISLQIRNPATGETAILSQNTLAIVDAVADRPVLDSMISVGAGGFTTGSVSGTEHQTVALKVKLDFPDNDGSETHTVVVKGVPGAWNLLESPGVTFTVVVNADGTKTYTATLTGDLNTTLKFDPGNWSSAANGDATITVVGIAVEKVTDGEITTANNTATVETKFNVHIEEDVPTLVAVAPPALIHEATLLVPGVDAVSGDITVDFHTDGPGNVTLSLEGLNALGLTSQGSPLTYTLSADGKTITAVNGFGQPVFTVQLGAPTSSGSEQTTPYTFTLLQPLDHAPGGGHNNLNIPFKFVATDSDGDTISGNIPVVVVDDTPTAGTIATGTDETTHLNVPFVGDVPMSPGADGVADVKLNSFNASGSMTGSALQSHGVPVIVSLSTDSTGRTVYIGMAGSKEVFRMTLDPATGKYTFLQSGPLDHADGNNINDVISLHFGFGATDRDGDTANGTITINVRDDAPIAVADVDQVNIGETVTSGNVMTNDTMSNDGPNVLKQAGFGGATKSFATPDGVDAGGKFVLIAGDHGTLKLYEDGKYTYTYNNTNFAGAYTDQFNYTIIDFDGDTSTTTLTIDIVTTGPGTPPVITHTLDESFDLGDVFTGTLSVSGAVDYDLTTVTTGGSMSGGTLTSNGVPVVITLVGNEYVGMAGTTPVFTLTLNPTTGGYTYTQHAPLDHADGTDPNDVITLTFGYDAQDGLGNSISGTIVVNVLDDAPVAIADTNSIAAGTTTATGNVMTNDVMSQDEPNMLESVGFNGTAQSFVLPAGVDAGGPFLLINGDYGTLKIYQNGNYTYTYHDGNFAGTYVDKFDYVLWDNDGDTSTTTLTITINDNGPGAPAVITHTVDESFDIGDVFGGTLTVPGAVGYDLTSANTSGSMSGGSLKSNGVPVTITLVGNDYVGMAGTTEIFRLTLNPTTGAYTFTQYGPLDHADGSNPNDVITLTFGYNAEDGLGNTLPGTIVVNVLDDAPVAVADTNSVAGGTSVTTGNVLTNDTMSQDDVNSVKSVGFGTASKSFSSPDGTDAGGAFLLINGAYGTLKIYANGNYTYTYTSANFAGTYTDQFKYVLVDGDGDTSNTTLTIDITDNGPGAPPVITHTVDESFDLGNDVSGVLNVTGATGYDLTTATSGGSLSGGVLSSNGTPVTIVKVGNDYVGMAGTTEVFRLELNPSTGSYTFTQYEPLDHADGSDPNDVITLTFGYNAEDGLGGTVPGTIVVNVLDDAPVAVADTNSLSGGATVATGNVITNDVLSQDEINSVKSVSFGGTTKSFSSPDGTDAGGPFLLVNGEHGTLKVYANGNYTYTYTDGNFAGNYTDQFNYTLVDRDGDTSSTTLTINIADNGPNSVPAITRSIDETDDIGNTINGVINVPEADSFNLVGHNASGSMSGGSLKSNGVPVNILMTTGGDYVGMAGTTEIFRLTLNPTTGAYTFTQYGPLDHADGSNPNDVITLTFNYEAHDGSGNTLGNQIIINILDDAPVAVADTNNVAGGTTTAVGNVLTNDNLSEDAVNSVKGVSFGSTSKSFATPDGVDAGGAFLLINGDHGTLKIYANGNYTYTYTDTNFAGTYTDQFNYILVDGDGDTSNTTLTINITDNGPGVPPVIVHTIDETTDINASITGALSVTGASSYELTSVTASGSLAGGTLKSGGVPVVITLVGGDYVGMAGTTEVFRLTLNAATGAYTFVQKAAIDHADGMNPNDVITLTFGYDAEDGLGNSIGSTIVVNILDDAPVAVADVNTVPDNSSTASGNVLLNDTFSQDNTNLIKQAGFGSATKSFSTPDGVDGGGAFVMINGNYGVLKLYQNGNYTYTYNNASHTGAHTEVFNYTLVDYDGDTSATTLTINIIDSGPGVPPEIIRTIDETTDINLAVTGTITVANATQFAMGNPLGGSDFLASGSMSGGSLKSNGVAVTVTLVGGVYVGMAGTTEVFRLEINPATGLYTFIQKAALDHADGSNPNDVINLSFKYTARDADGDAVSNSIVIHVLDDAPVAVADVNTVTGGNTSVTDNVLTNDDLSNDFTNVVSRVTFGTTVVNFGTSTSVTINGNYGTLVLNKDGTYTYTAFSSTLQPGAGGTKVDQFNYTLKDGDGDTSQTTLTINTVQPKLIVGTNTGDSGSGGIFDPNYHIGTGKGTINGTAASDILVGDMGGTSAGPTKDFNVVLILDTSASMNAAGKLAMLKAAVLNLLAEFHDYANGQIRVHIVTFNENIQYTQTYTVTTNGGYNDAVTFVNGLAVGVDHTNYEAPLDAAIKWLNGSTSGTQPISGAENHTYFVSDGEPNRYLNDAGGVIIGSAIAVKNQITGVTDTSNEVAMLKALSNVIGVGINVGTTGMGILDLIDSDGNAINVTNPADLTDTFANNNPVPPLTLKAVGNDTINGGDGHDIIFGDAVNTDYLVTTMGLPMPLGSGWAALTYMETHFSFWTRTNTLNYLKMMYETAGRETVDASGHGRTGGHDTLTGGNGDDIIFGQEGNDNINGGAGNDIISGGTGINTLTGGLGADTFLFLKNPGISTGSVPTGGKDTITDYSNAQGDKLDISDLLVGTSYHAGANVNNYVRIEGSTGNVYVDMTGTGSFGSANHIATINGAGSLGTINVILNDTEGTKTVHTV